MSPQTSAWLFWLAVTFVFAGYEGWTRDTRERKARLKPFLDYQRELSGIQFRIRRDAKIKAIWRGFLVLIGRRARLQQVVTSDESGWKEIARERQPGGPDIISQRRTD